MKRILTTTWAVVAMAMMACSSSDEKWNDPDDGGANVVDNELKTISLTQSQQQLVESNNDFAFNLMRQVYSDKKSQIVSPISITYALGMLNNGAAGETQQQINRVLGFSSAAEVNDFCRKMLTEAPMLDKLTKVMIGNTIYMNKDYVLKPAFKQTANDYYDAQPETRDFYDGKTMGVINQWASDHTEKMITEVLNASTFDPSAVSYLLNAIYFKGAWANKFDKSQTRNEAFNGGSTVPMMHQQTTLTYGESDNCQMLSLPYGNGAYRMTVLLPREGSTVADVLEDLTADRWQRMPMADAEVDVKLPSFESNTDVTLNDIMSQLGMPKAFTDYAEFPDFCNVPTRIGLMKQVARIKVDEAGTEAAAVTVIGMVTTAISPEPRLVTFHATRPFLYVISERSTGAIFFIGQYNGK